jgi:hypothetical protein
VLRYSGTYIIVTVTPQDVVKWRDAPAWDRYWKRTAEGGLNSWKGGVFAGTRCPKETDLSNFVEKGGGEGEEISPAVRSAAETEAGEEPCSKEG